MASTGASSRAAVIASCALMIASAAVGSWLLLRGRGAPEAESGFTGSSACRGCHEGFYEKWATSWHGMALRPCTPILVRETFTPMPAPLAIGDRSWRFEMDRDGGVLVERGPGGEKAWPIAHVLGGKNVIYLLTPFPGGRLQVMPLAYDTRQKEWYDSAGSMVRHFRSAEDAPVDWKDRALTFNTSCYSCHVSQLDRGYSFETDTYRTTWGEPGINCEACHFTGRRHVEAAKAVAPKAPEPLEIIVTRTFSHDQMDSLCATCHAKGMPLDEGFLPGERFFDHSNLVALEDRDFYPDGRDLGENYTYGPWLLSPCSSSGQLDCMHCHTSSGQNKYPGAEADQACLPCHERHVKDPAAHSFHPAASEASRCISCHMPETTFARMRRHDHTLLPPAPAATLEFGSPNACNLCHKDQDARWADQWVRKWYPRDYQAPLLARARLIDGARKEDWSKLREMVDYLGSKGRNAMYSAGLLRLLQPCPMPAKWPAFLKALRDPSPLVRASAAAGLASFPDRAAFDALVDATGDDFRLVRTEAAAALSGMPLDSLDPQRRRKVDQATEEHLAVLRSRADDPARHYNLGNFFQARGDLDGALKNYEAALKLDPSMVMALVNGSLVHARRGDPVKAEDSLRRALRADPQNSTANFNLGLLLGELGRGDEAAACLQASLKTDPRFAEAAYNLAILVEPKDPGEAMGLLRRAAGIRPDDPRHAYTLAFFQSRHGDPQGAAENLRALLDSHPGHGDSVMLLGAIYEGAGQTADAVELYRRASQSPELPAELRARLAAQAQALGER